MRLAGSVLALAVAAALGSSNAAVIYDISITTAALIGHPAGPFSLEAQLNDGSGTNDANNTATMSGFTFGSGGPTGSPSLTGGATGSLSSSVALTDSSFFNQFIQGFTPGSTLSFKLSLTTNVDAGGVPDEFSLAILDKTAVEIPTTGPANALLIIDIDFSSPMVSAFATDTSTSPAAGGPPIRIAAPTVTLVTTGVPEPGS